MNRTWTLSVLDSSTSRVHVSFLFGGDQHLSRQELLRLESKNLCPKLSLTVKAGIECDNLLCINELHTSGIQSIS